MRLNILYASHAILGRWLDLLRERPGQNSNLFKVLLVACSLIVFSTNTQTAQAQTLTVSITPQSTTYSEGQSVTVTFSGGVTGENYFLTMYDDLNNFTDFSSGIDVTPFYSNANQSGNTVTYSDEQSSYFIVTFNNGSAGSPRVFEIVKQNDINDYGDSDSFTIVAASAPCTSPNVTISATPSLTIASGSSVTLTADGADSYIWDTTPTSSNTSVSVSPTQTTVYSVTGTTGECSGTASATITTTLNCSVTFTGSLTGCQFGNFVPITASLPGSNQGYSWAAPSGVNWLTNNEATFNASFTTAGVKTLTVTATNQEGCNISATYSITAHPQPSLTITAVPAYQPANANLLPNELNFIVYSGSSLTLSAIGAYSYTWGHNNEATAAFVFTANDPLNFEVVGTAQTGCSASRDIYLDVQNCQTSLNASATSVCIGGIVSLTALNSNSLNLAMRENDRRPIHGAARVATSNTPMVSYTWVAPAGAAFSGPANNSLVSASFTTTGVKTFTAITTTPEGCISSSTVSVTVNEMMVSIAPSTTTISGGQSVTLTASGADSYLWDTTPASSNTSVSVSPTQTTVYSVTGSSSGCTGTASAIVTVDCGEPIQAKAASVTQTAVLGPGNCSVMLQGQGYGTGYTITGPNGYVFSAVYRRVGSYTINSLSVTQPGIYTLKVSYSDACGHSSFDTMTYVVTGEACK